MVRIRSLLASSSGADFTSSSSWRIMLPIRITLAGSSTMSVTEVAVTGSASGSRGGPSTAMPCGVTT
jgi:hypothetical protein